MKRQLDIDTSILVKWISESQKKSYSLLKVAFLQNICARLALSKRGGRALPARPARRRRRHRALAYVALLVWPLGLRYAQSPVRRSHGLRTAGKPARPFQPCFLMLPTLSLPVLVHTLPALAFKAAKPDMAQKIVSGLHFRSRSLYGPGLGVEYC